MVQWQYMLLCFAWNQWLSMNVSMKHHGLNSKVIFTLTDIALTKGHSSKTKSQVSVLRTIGPLSCISFCNAIQINIIDFVFSAFGT